MMVLEIVGLNLGVLSDLKNWDINGGTISKREDKDKEKEKEKVQPEVKKTTA